MKRIIATVLTCAIVCNLTACGGATQDASRGMSIYGDETAEQAAESDELRDFILSDTLPKLTRQESDADKEETVYVISDASGEVDRIIVSDRLRNFDNADELTDVSVLKNIENVKGTEAFTTHSGHSLQWQSGGRDIWYRGTTEEPLPVAVKVTYYLEGKEVSAEEIAGRSGNVKIRFDYENRLKQTVLIDEEEAEIYTPFLMISAMMLDADVFSDVSIDHGQVISDEERYTVLGYALPGLEQSLSVTDEQLEDLNLTREDVELPQSVEVSAYTTGFEIGMTMTVATPNATDMLGIDFADTEGIDDLKEDMKELSEGSKDLVDGVTELKDGTGEFHDASGELKDGVGELKDGTGELKDGVGELKDGLIEFKDGALTLKDGVGMYTDGVDQLSDGLSAMSDAVGQVKDGSVALAKGIGELKTGISTFMSYLEQIKQYAAALQATKEFLELDSGLDMDTYFATHIKGSVASGTSTQLRSPRPPVPAEDEDPDAQEDDSQEDDVEEDDVQEGDAQEDADVTGDSDHAGTDEGDSTGGDVTQPADPGDADPSEADSVSADADDTTDTTDEDGTDAATDFSDDTDDTGASAKDPANSLMDTGMVRVRSRFFLTDSGTQEAMLNAALRATTEAYFGSQYDATVLRNMWLGSGNTPAGGTRPQGMIAFYAHVCATLEAYGPLLSDDVSKISDGINGVSEGADALADGLKQLKTEGMDQLAEGASALKEASSELREGTSEFYDATSELSDGVSDLYDGVGELDDGVGELLDGVGEFHDGVGELDDGIGELLDGVKELDSEGIQKLTKLLGKNLPDFRDRLKAIQEAGEAYHSFTGIREGAKGNVKFIFKTDSIKAVDRT